MFTFDHVNWIVLEITSSKHENIVEQQIKVISFNYKLYYNKHKKPGNLHPLINSLMQSNAIQYTSHKILLQNYHLSFTFLIFLLTV